MSGPGRFYAKSGIGLGMIIFIGAVILALAIAISFATGFWSDTTVERRGETAQQEQTQGTGSYRIAQYDAFHRQCTALITAQEQIDADADPANSEGLPPSIAATNKQANLRSYREQAADYNAKAAATDTSGRFRDSGLPYSVPTNYTANQEKISCG